ncbi:MAG: uracil-DNA glycosylase [Spirochaetaceae bacterium]|jgi:DNA polymerase|nr:uracil-DNA glycosylase [Spirochaetaceae bacterium]
MTAQEKAALASFLETVQGSLFTGYQMTRHAAEEADFVDDPVAGDDPADGGMATGDEADETPEHIAREIASCRMCGLCEQRKNTVPGEGSLHPLVMVIGEAPGADEDAQGRPFVGPAGKLLDKMLASIGLSRETNCFIANILKCRPPNNRDPEPDERAACIHFLEHQIVLLKPRAILCAGRVSAQTLLQTTAPMASLRNGKRWEYALSKGGVEITTPLFATYHPSALLRNEGWKRPAWEDLKAFREFLDSNAG